MFNNRYFHRLVVDDVDVSFRTSKGGIKHDKAWLIDFRCPENNDFVAANQLTVIEQRNHRRLDVVLFVNGLPLVIIELKNHVDDSADVWSAFDQLQTYKQELPSFFQYNEILVVLDRFHALAGTINCGRNRFIPWKTIDGIKVRESKPQLETLLKGMLKPEVLLDIVRHFIVFEISTSNCGEYHDKTKPDEPVIKKVAAYHQYNAVNRAVKSTIRALGGDLPFNHVNEDPEDYGLPSIKDQKPGDKRAGVVWHTQGSGKSLTMVFYAGKLVLEPVLENPTIIVLTDRNDLDDQLFGTFCRCKELLRQEPKQAGSREELKQLLKVASGGIIFTTIQKFLPDEKGTRYPTLSERKNIVVIADEAHRSQYDFIDGFARHMRPDWYHRDDDRGVIKVVMTVSASDPPQWQEHIRNKERRRAIGERLKDPNDQLKIVIVRDMWLTGFDAPPLHTMYIDKPMKGHTLMRTIARVNRVFEGKPGGLVVDYIGIGVALKEALAEYTEGDREQTGIPQEKALNLLKEEYDIITGMFHGFDYRKFYKVPLSEKMSVIREAIEHILVQENGKQRLLDHVTRLHRVFKLVVPQPEAIAIRDDVQFFIAVKAAMAKTTDARRAGITPEVDSAIEQILSKTIVSDRVIDVFAVAGLKKPDISILSEEFLEEIRQMP